MSACTESERFAACLRSLKERSGLSYAALAAKAGTSGSSVHRYCLGSSVPQDYGTVHRLAVACGASPEELRTLHRFWAVADAARDPGPTDPGPTGPGPMDQERTGPERTGPERTEPTTSPEPELALLEPVIGPPEPSHGSGAVGRRRRRIRAGIAVGLAVLFLGGMAWNLPSLGPAEGSEGGPGQVAGERPKEDGRPLFTSGCREVVAMGQHDTCVREVQRLLHAKGAVIDVDGDFGPQTLRRVTAFQVLAGIDPPNGVVGDSTKRALYRSGARMDTWTQDEVRRRIRACSPRHRTARSRSPTASPSSTPAHPAEHQRNPELGPVPDIRRPSEGAGRHAWQGARSGVEHPRGQAVVEPGPGLR